MDRENLSRVSPGVALRYDLQYLDDPSPPRPTDDGTDAPDIDQDELAKMVALSGEHETAVPQGLMELELRRGDAVDVMPALSVGEAVWARSATRVLDPPPARARGVIAEVSPCRRYDYDVKAGVSVCRRYDVEFDDGSRGFGLAPRHVERVDVRAPFRAAIVEVKEQELSVSVSSSAPPLKLQHRDVLQRVLEVGDVVRTRSLRAQALVPAFVISVDEGRSLLKLRFESGEEESSVARARVRKIDAGVVHETLAGDVNAPGVGLEAFDVRERAPFAASAAATPRRLNDKVEIRRAGWYRAAPGRIVAVRTSDSGAPSYDVETEAYKTDTFKRSDIIRGVGEDELGARKVGDQYVVKVMEWAEGTIAAVEDDENYRIALKDGGVVERVPLDWLETNLQEGNWYDVMVSEWSTGEITQVNELNFVGGFDSASAFCAHARALTHALSTPTQTRNTRFSPTKPARASK